MHTHHDARPYEPLDFDHFRATHAWRKHEHLLTFGRGQTLAILDDGCNLAVPQWNTRLPWGPKVIANWNSIDRNANPAPGPIGYHGTSVGWPSSINHDGVIGVAYNNHVIHVRCVSIVHLTRDESDTMAGALQWVIDHHQQYNITAVNFAMLDDQPHRAPLSATAIDAPLATLRKLNIWVSAPCGNNEYTHGISWPACQPHCYAIGAVLPQSPDDLRARGEVVIRDRWSNTDILVPATATSSSNAYIAGASMLLREAIAQTRYDWKRHADNLPDAMMAIFKQTGTHAFDPATQLHFKRLDLLAALDHVTGVWG